MNTLLKDYLGYKEYKTKDTGDLPYYSIEDHWRAILGKDTAYYFYGQAPRKTIGGSLKKVWGYAKKLGPLNMMVRLERENE